MIKKPKNWRARRTKYLGSIYKRWHLDKYALDVIMHWKPGDQEGYVIADTMTCSDPCLFKLKEFPYRITPQDFEKIRNCLEDTNQKVPSEIKQGESK